MGRKVFISVLGTGFYGKCTYVKGEFASSETRFIQQATLEFLEAAKWKPTDTALFLLTEKAKTENWNQTITERKNFRTLEMETYHGLQQVLANMQLPFSSTVLDIPDGKDEEEMWDIFNILYNALEDEDELYFDLTHSFRYLPMLVLVLGNYSKFLKKVTVRHISYGNYEARDIQTNQAPIVDLLPLTALQDWTFAAADYLENGKANRLSNLCKSSLRLVLTEEDNKNACLLNEFADNLEKVIEERETCRGIAIIESNNTKALRETLNNLTTILIDPLEPVIGKIKESLDEFDENENIMNGFAAAQWCLTNGLYQQAVTILLEGIVTLICALEGLNWRLESDRMLVSSSLNIKAQKIKEAKWIIKTKNNTDEEKEVAKNTIKRIMDNIFVEVIYRKFKAISDLRNDFNHSGMRNKPDSSSLIKEKLTQLMDSVMEDINRLNLNAPC